MNLLAIDTSSDACSVAVQAGERIVERHVIEVRGHTRILVSMIRDALDDADIGIDNLDAVVLGNGPGSFIGMRIGASVAQGICHAADVRIVPVSSLTAVAVEVFQACTADHVVVAQDARMDEVYIGIFKRGPHDRPIHCADERILPIGEIDGLVPGSVAAGSAWQKYTGLIDANAELIEVNESCTLPRARHLLPPGLAALGQGQSVDPQQLVPAYLRDKVAEPTV